MPLKDADLEWLRKLPTKGLVCKSRARCEYQVPDSVLQTLQPRKGSDPGWVVYSRQQVFQAAVTYYRHKRKEEARVAPHR